jgi:hypothetical protein
MFRSLRSIGLAIILLGLPLSASSSADTEEMLVAETEVGFNRLWEETLKWASVSASSKDVAWAAQIQEHVAGPFLTYWALDDLLSQLLGADNDNLKEPMRSQVINALGVTLTRYIYEVLVDYDLNQKTIQDLEIYLTQEAPSIHASVKGPLGIHVALKYMLLIRDGQVFIRDMEVANIRYSNWKKSFYRKYAKKSDWQGLIFALNKKNDRFFTRFCESNNDRIGMPIYIQTACDI